MRKSDVCKSKYFRAADFPADWEKTVIIEMARTETFEGGRGKDGGSKLVVYFKREQSGLVCGPVLWDEMIKATGEEDSDDWAEHRVQLYRTMTMFGGKSVPAIRVREAPAETVKAKVKEAA
jgi:hypothetical protein